VTDGARPRLRLTAPGPLFSVVAVLCLAYLPIFLGQILFYRDPAHWNFPARMFVRDSVLRGDWPLWNPQQGLGFSVLANPLYGLFYPPNWLFLITPRDWVASMLTWQCFAHLVWGSAGIVVLARQLGLRGPGLAVAGLAWGLSGYTTASWTTGLLLLSGAWLPWCGVGLVSLVRSVRAGAAGWMGGVARAALPVAMALLLGEVFAAIIGVGFGLGMAVLAVHQDRAGGAAQPWRRTASAVAAALALAGGIGAVVVLPARAIAATNLRGQPLARVVAETCSLNPLRLIEFVAPGSMGYAYGQYPAAPWVGEKLLDGFPLMYSVYMGASVVALALLALGRGRRAGSLVGAGAVFALLVSLGRYTPVHNVIRLVVRPLAYMRYPEKYLVAFVALLALLAGLGAARVLDGDDPARRPWRRTAIGAAVLVLLAALAPAIFPVVWAPFVRWGAIKGALAALLVLAVQLLRGRASPRALALVLVAGVAADLAVAAWPHLDFAPRALSTGVPRAATAILEEHRQGGDVAAPRVYRAEKTEATIRRWTPAPSHAEAEARSIASLIPNTVTTFGVSTLPGYDAAIPTLLPQLWSTGQKVGQSVLRLLGIGYVVLPIEDPSDPVERRSGITPMLDPLPGARLYRVPGSLPRVYLVGRAETAGDDEALARLFEPDVVEGKLALVAGAALPGPAGRAGECALVAFSNNRVAARCRAERPAMAVFLEQHDVGWSATVDGAPAPLLRANLLMRAVPVPPGTHLVTLAYAPPGLRAGALLSGFSTVICTVMGLTPPLLRRRRRPPR
jgi:hypothetical protein